MTNVLYHRPQYTHLETEQNTATHLQHTTTHFATYLQHTATHLQCSTLQHICNTLQHICKTRLMCDVCVVPQVISAAMHFNTVQHTATHLQHICNTLQHICNTLQHICNNTFATLCNTFATNVQFVKYVSYCRSSVLHREVGQDLAARVFRRGASQRGREREELS